MPKTIAPVSPGTPPHRHEQISAGEIHRRSRVSRIGDIVAGKRAITADTDLRLCRLFSQSDGWWLRLQADFDTRLAKAKLAGELKKIVPLRAA